MDFTLPFTDDTVQRLVGKTVVFSENHYNDHTFSTYLTFEVKSGGDSDRGYFEVVNGVLRKITTNGLLCEFNGVENRNGVVYAVGISAVVASKHGHNRMIMHERVPLKMGEFGICISSHVTYAGKTLPVILDSLKKAGYSMENVYVVVGGYDGEKTETMDGATVIYNNINGNGFGGLLSVNDKFEYWLLLHDTCEAERTFVENFADVDVGLSPDVVRIRSDLDDWTGFYHKRFVDKIRSVIVASNKDIKAQIDNLADVVTVLSGKVSIRGSKDVYGKGNKRIIEKLPIGIRKYRGTMKRRIP